MLQSIESRPDRSTAARWVSGLLILFVAACASPGTDDGGERAGPVSVRALLSHDPPSLSLIGKSDVNLEKLAVQITDSLVQFDPQMQIVPRVAESWSFADAGRELTFRLREGVRWHDGRPVTAADVVFTVEQVTDPLVESATWSVLFRDMTSIDAIDDRTLVVRYDRPSLDVLEAWRVPLLPSHLAERGADLLTGTFNEHPVGCGPFRFLRYAPGEEVVLEANDDYWDGRPKIDRLVLRIYPDQRTGFQALLIGDVDILAATPSLWQQARESDQAGRLESFAFYRNSVWTVRWNLAAGNPFFGDARVRRALIHALDRRRFIDATLSGMGRVAATSYHPDLAWTDPDLAPLPFDRERAERELDEAGWRRPSAGELRERDGVPFRFTLMTASSTMQIADQTAAWLQQSWAEIGVQAEIEKLEWGEFRERRREGRFEASMGGFSMTPTPDQWELYHSGARVDGANYGGYADPETDRLLDLGRSALDSDERLRIYRELQHRLLAQQPIGWLMHFASPVLYDRRLGGVEPSVLDYWRTTRGPRVWTWAAAPDEG